MSSVAYSRRWSTLAEWVDPQISERQAAALAWMLVGLGVVVRLVRYLMRFPLWGDEVMLADNLLDRGYAGLAAGLDHTQVAAVGYLWAEKLLVDWFGFNEFSLRGVACLCGIGALVLFRIAAGHVLRGLPLVAAVGIFAVAYYPIRHAAEVKPYACDLFAAVLLIEPFLAWLGNRERTRSLWRLIPAAIIALPISFTAAFVGGGISIALGWEAWRRRSRDVAVKNIAVPWLAYNAALIGTFLVLWVTVLQSQFAANGGKMQHHWEAGFPPPITAPGAWLLWFAEAHTGEALAYPFGDDRGGSILQFTLAVIGGIACWRSDRRGIVRMILATLAVGFAACLLHKYPYGYGERLHQYWAPLVCLLVGEGLGTAIAALRQPVPRRRLRVGFVSVLMVIGVGMIARDLTHPYKSWNDEQHRDFSRWFWEFAGRGEPLVDLRDDLDVRLFDDHEALFYRAFRRIYDRSPQNAAGLQTLPAGKPVRCVAFGRHGLPPNGPEFDAWMTAMQCDYVLAGEERYEVRIERTERGTYHVWRFEPRTETATLPLQALRR